MASRPSKRHLKNHLACELCVLKAWTCLHSSLSLPRLLQGCVPNFPKRKSPSQLNLYMGERVNIPFLTREERQRTSVVETATSWALQPWSILSRELECDMSVYDAELNQYWIIIILCSQSNIVTSLRKSYDLSSPVFERLATI